MSEKAERSLLMSLTSVPVVVLLNTGMVNVALASVREELHVTVADVAWLVAAYAVPLVVLAPLGNTLGDLLGKRRLLMLGLLLFALASGICALSISFSWLLAGRVLQGVGISGLSPVCMSLIADTFAPDERGRAIGSWQSAGPVSFAIAPVLGGLVVQFSGWRTIFYVLSAVSLAGMYFVMRYVPHLGSRRTFDEADWGGMLTLSVGIGAPLLALARLTSQASLQHVLLLLCAGMVGLIAFACLELRQTRPLLDLRLFNRWPFTCGIAAAGLRSSSIASTSFLLSLSLQEIGGYTPTQVGLLFISRSVVSFFSIPLGGRLADRLRPSLVGATGMALMSMSLAFFARLRSWTLGRHVAVNLAFFGLGMGMALPSIPKAVVDSVRREQIGMATGLERMSHSGGVVVGPSLIGSLLTVRMASPSAPAPMEATQAYNEMFWVLTAVAMLGALLLTFSSCLPPHASQMVDAETDELEQDRDSGEQSLG